MFGIIGLILVIVGLTTWFFKRKKDSTNWERLKIKSKEINPSCKIKQECGIRPESIEFTLTYPNLFVEFRENGEVVFWRIEDDIDDWKYSYGKKRTYSQMLSIIEGFFKETNV